MTIEDILSEEEIEKVKIMVYNEAMYSSVRNEFKRLTRKEIAVFKDFYFSLKKKSYSELGFKNESYYDTEDLDELYPQYTWEDLSHAEKSWYNIREKSNKKK